MPLGLLPGAPDRRPDVARDQRSQRRADDDRSGGDVFGEHRPGVRRRHHADAVDRHAADADGADPAAAGLDQRPLLRQRRFTSASRPSRRSSPISAPSSRKRSPACASSAPTTRRRTRSSGSARANDEYVRRNRVLIRLQGLFYPSMTLFLGFGSLLVLWLGSRDVIRGAHHAGRVRGLQRAIS